MLVKAEVIIGCGVELQHGAKACGPTIFGQLTWGEKPRFCDVADTFLSARTWEDVLLMNEWNNRPCD